MNSNIVRSISLKNAYQNTVNWHTSHYGFIVGKNVLKCSGLTFALLLSGPCATLGSKPCPIWSYETQLMTPAKCFNFFLTDGPEMNEHFLGNPKTCHPNDLWSFLHVILIITLSIWIFWFFFHKWRILRSQELCDSSMVTKIICRVIESWTWDSLTVPSR